MVYYPLAPFSYLTAVLSGYLFEERLFLQTLLSVDF